MSGTSEGWVFVMVDRAESRIEDPTYLWVDTTPTSRGRDIPYASSESATIFSERHDAHAQLILFTDRYPEGDWEAELVPVERLMIKEPEPHWAVRLEYWRPR